MNFNCCVLNSRFFNPVTGDLLCISCCNRIRVVEMERPVRGYWDNVSRGTRPSMTNRFFSTSCLNATTYYDAVTHNWSRNVT